ncbi:hypothetical protein H4V99_003387 [Cryobacterium sp. CG_9.6]|nr:hypothetical protein [Cryobacterium sp. CG_9.6]
MSILTSGRQKPDLDASDRGLAGLFAPASLSGNEG